MADEVKRNVHASKSDSEIGLENIDDAGIVNLLRHRRRLVIECLDELLQRNASAAKRHAAASALGTLTELGKKLAPEAGNHLRKDQHRF